jgi:hypothetical protein
MFIKHNKDYKVEITVGIFLTLLVMAFVCEFIDASIGMGYGTILTPILLIMGFNPILAVPAVLISQAFGGLLASLFHHQLENVSFKPKSKDLKLVMIISGFGIIATIFAASIAVGIPKDALKTYIGILCLFMGFLILRNRPFTFSWKKMIGLGILSAFNKGFSGGGFGPVVTGGQIVSGQDHKAAVGVTTLAEAPICICGFFAYVIARTVNEISGSVLDMPFSIFIKKMFSPEMLQWELILALFIGSITVAPLAAFTTKSIKKEKVHLLIGAIIMILGTWTLVKTWYI